MVARSRSSTVVADNAHSNHSDNACISIRYRA